MFRRVTLLKSTNQNVSKGTCQDLIAVNRVEMSSESFGLSGGVVSGDGDQYLSKYLEKIACYHVNLTFENGPGVYRETKSLNGQ